MDKEVGAAREPEQQQNIDRKLSRQDEEPGRGADHDRGQDSRKGGEKSAADPKGKNNDPQRGESPRQPNGEFGYPEEIIRSEDEPICERRLLWPQLVVEARRKVVS